MKDKLISQIKNYTPCNEQEEVDKALLLRLLSVGADLTRRENLEAHLTASAWVVTPDRQKVLMAYHNLYNSWAWLGGHADGEWDLARVARKEAEEESGISGLRQVTEGPVSLEILPVFGHEKKGKYVPCHLHLNVTYLFEADPTLNLQIKPDENSGVDWIPMAELPAKTSEPWMCERIYSKLCRRAREV